MTDEADIDAALKVVRTVASNISVTGGATLLKAHDDIASTIATLTDSLGKLERMTDHIGRIARSDGHRAFDDTIRDLGRIDDLCRSLKLNHEENSR